MIFKNRYCSPQGNGNAEASQIRAFYSSKESRQYQISCACLVMWRACLPLAMPWVCCILDLSNDRVRPKKFFKDENREEAVVKTKMG